MTSIRILGALAALPFVASALPAQVVSVDVVNEIDWTAGAETLGDGDARRLVLPSTLSARDLGVLPGAAGVTALHLLDDGRRLFALDTTADLGGPVARPTDLVSWNGSTYALELVGAAAGIPAGARIDAAGRVRQAGVIRTLVSFDVTVGLDGGALTVDDEDLVGWNGSAWSLFLDGSAIGIPAALDVDGFDRDPVDGTLFLSFDTGGELGGVIFDDDDVVAFDGADWSLAFDASAALGAPFAAGDLAALGVRTVNIFADGFEIGTTIEWSAAVP